MIDTCRYHIVHALSDAGDDLDTFNVAHACQELTALRRVEFFFRKGHRLSNKVSLEQPIGEITGIQANAPRSYLFENLGISARMTRAKSRETRAFERLQNELEQSESSLSNIPYLRNRQFVGWEVELAQLGARPLRDQQTPIPATSGSGCTRKFS
nr:hypothetical protein CFP56_21368 [Quercus suber]